ncbi:MAG: PAS domain-containing protein, partial [Pseudomonadota bacterium]
MNKYGEAASVLKARIADLERDLRSTQQRLQTTIEALETSYEDLHATNEKLIASNEELQSTNEALQSVNEELYTVSAEHQRKIEELTELTNDMDQLLKSTEIGTVFLDAELCVRRFTPAATRTFDLVAQDIGRPLGHITHRFDTDMLSQMIADVRQQDEAAEREVVADGRSYLLRILPFTPM